MRELKQNELNLCAGGSIEVGLAVVGLIAGVGYIASITYLAYHGKFELTGWALGPDGTISPVISIKR